MIETKIIRINGRQRFAVVSFEESENIINDMTKKGYSYKGFVPTRIIGYGKITEIDLIFEKEE